MIVQKFLASDEAHYQLQDYLDKAYSSFIDSMSGVFNLKRQDIHKLNIIEGGYLARGRIVIHNKEFKIEIEEFYGNETFACCEQCWERWLLTRTEILSHEVGHHLHIYANEEYWLRRAFEKRNGGITKKTWFLGELVAEISSLFYFDHFGLLEKIIDYKRNVGYNDYQNVDEAAFQLFSKPFSKSEFLQLVHSSVDECSSLLNYYLPFIEKGYSVSLEDYFSTCVCPKIPHHLRQLEFDFND
ncbi:MAG: hypothetical protein AABX16_01205 [Nanoarchaeota archaeon]